MTAPVKAATHEHAGFLYDIVPEGDTRRAIPAPGQHPAAGKERHCRAALEGWLEEQHPTVRRFPGHG